ncbi:MAG: mechanosensitive ion channel family protein [Rikenellaceae bacterium]
MKKILRYLIFLLLLLVVGCDNSAHLSQRRDEGVNLIDSERVDRLIKGDRVKNLYQEYGKGRVKILADFDADSVASLKRRYYIYNEGNELLFVAIAPTSGDNQDLIEHIIIKNHSLRTEDGVGSDSSIGEIAQSYPDATVIQHRDKLYLYLPTVDLYFGVNPNDVAGYDSEFIVDIPIDSISMDASPLNMSVNWYALQEGVGTLQYWSDVWRIVFSWLTHELPAMLAQSIFVYILLQLGLWLIRRVKRLILNRTIQDEDIDQEETTKRVNTLAGIISGVLSIVAWVTIVLIVLSKFNINIGPIIASAGIVGLAVGFGAQELVRDYISGFFILFENQLRTGDIAIIDGKEGFVEKIELRTITLRDLSGVVHIFQNGKINSLSNMTKEWSAITIEMGVSYREDVDRVMEVMLHEGRELRKSAEFGSLILSDIEMLGLDKFDDSAVVFKVVIRTRPRMQWRVKREYQRRLKIAFDREGIEIPFPQVTINHPSK